MRAFTLESTDRTLGMLLTPGDRVDVLGSAHGVRMDKDAHKTAELRMRTVAEDLLVLAIGSELGAHGAAGKARQGAVTLSVTPEQSQVLAAAEQSGALRLVVRNPDDVALTEMHGLPTHGLPGAR
jgi:Flp pilus assembly protein CpaB